MHISHKVFTTNVTKASALGKSVVQPTAQEMVRYWQAYKMVENAIYPRAVRRKLSASLEPTQLRLSVVIFTIITSVLAVVAAAVARRCEPLDEHGERMVLPQSQLHWMVEAARQRYAESDDHKTHVDYVEDHKNLFCEVSTTRKGLSRTQITADKDDAVIPIHDDHSNLQPLHDVRGGLSAATSALENELEYKSPLQPFESYFDPYSLYNRREPAT